MNTRIRLGSFERTRCRLKCLSSGQILAGWITAATSVSVTVRMSTQSSVSAEGNYAVEAYGTGARALFIARAADMVIEGADVLLKLDVAGAIRFIDGNQEGRVEVSGLMVSAHLPEVTHLGEAHDLSGHGLGASFACEVPVGQRIGVGVHVDRAMFMMEAECRHCTRLESGRCKVGFRVTGMGRIEQAKWNTLVDGVDLTQAA